MESEEEEKEEEEEEKKEKEKEKEVTSTLGSTPSGFSSYDSTEKRWQLPGTTPSSAGVYTYGQPVSFFGTPSH